MDDWHNNLVESPDAVRSLLKETRRIAVLGIKTEAQADQPAYYVAKAAQDAGYDVVPVPVYYPEAKSILGQPVYRKLADIQPPVDMIDVFRKPSDIPAHLDDILAAKPKSVWLQKGIRHPEVAEKLARAGIKVVQDL